MREIKFRGKRVDNGEWVYGSYFADKEMTDRVFILTDYVHDQNSPFDTEKRDFNIQGFEVDPKTVGQFTGEIDKNKVDISKGDRINFCGTSDWVVIWWSAGFDLQRKTQQMRLSECATEDLEIIGNIHENHKTSKLKITLDTDSNKNKSRGKK